LNFKFKRLKTTKVIANLDLSIIYFRFVHHENMSDIVRNGLGSQGMNFRFKRLKTTKVIANSVKPFGKNSQKIPFF